MKNHSALFVGVASVACLLAVTGEFITVFLSGTLYPGYNPLKDTMSSLGASVSPISDQISLWWMIMGILLVVFGAGFKQAFPDGGRQATRASWMIVLYGIGEGLGSGLFKANRIAGGLTTSALVHDILGGIGVIAILILPLILPKVIRKTEAPFFKGMSRIIFTGGILTVFLFLFRYSTNKENLLATYKGLWQRLFMLNTYIYLSTVAVIMLVRLPKSRGQS